MIDNFELIDKCLICNNDLEILLDLGDQPLANSYLKNKEIKEDKYPLHLCLCHNCFNLQIDCLVNPETLFQNYLYVSGTSHTMLNFFDEFASNSLSAYINHSNKVIKILEIACNDASQLDAYVKVLYKINPNIEIITVGIDPAKNIYDNISKHKNHDIYCEFFCQETVNKLRNKYESFDIIVAQNVFAHISYPHEFLYFISQLMHNHTQLYIQTSQKNMILENQFDTVYHEHINFFNTNSMNILCKKNNLILNNVEENSVHGTSYVFNISKTYNITYNLLKTLDKEKDEGLYNLDTYYKYKTNCQNYKNLFLNKIKKFKSDNKEIIAFGSTAKSMTIFNYCNISANDIKFIIDENSLKQYMFTPGSHIQVLPISSLKNISKDTLIIVNAWNFYDEIKMKIIKYLQIYNILFSVTLLNLNTLEEEVILK